MNDSALSLRLCRRTSFSLLVGASYLGGPTGLSMALVRSCSQTEDFS